MLRITNTLTYMYTEMKTVFEFHHTYTRLLQKGLPPKANEMCSQFMIPTQYIWPTITRNIYVYYMSFDGKRTQTVPAVVIHIRTTQQYLRAISINAETLPKFLMDSVLSYYPHLSIIVYVCMFWSFMYCIHICVLVT